MANEMAAAHRFRANMAAKYSVKPGAFDFGRCLKGQYRMEKLKNERKQPQNGRKRFAGITACLLAVAIIFGTVSAPSIADMEQPGHRVLVSQSAIHSLDGNPIRFDLYRTVSGDLKMEVVKF